MSAINQEMTRRGFLGLGAVAASAALAACGGAPEPDGGADSGSGSADVPSGSDYIRFGCEAAYAPYEWKQSEENEFTLPISNLDGQFADGYDIQLDKMIGEKLGRTPIVVNMSFSGLIAALENDQIDAICAGMSATEERKQSVDFSHPYLKAGVAIMVASDSQWANATSLEDFRGASILGQKNS
ncbi:MAG: transporter substrate-binding domain-containing protein, partial [Atopobiaceae bacterium]|nr:transporter substrate-binding domain-containing protein [Atopobiaceae bacterium]